MNLKYLLKSIVSATLLMSLPAYKTQAREIEIRGRVTDEMGNAVEGAAIKVHLQERLHPTTSALGRLLGTGNAKSDRDGKFDVEKLTLIDSRQSRGKPGLGLGLPEAESLTITDARELWVYCDVICDGFVDKQEQITFTPDKSKESSISIAVQMTRGKPFACQVVDPSGAPVADAEVLASSGSPFFTCFRHNTDRDGIVRLSVPNASASVTVIVRLSQGAHHRQTIFCDEKSTTQITLERGTPVTGKLVDTQGRPLAGIPVVAQRNEKTFPSVNVVAMTQRDGSFEFGELLGEFLVSTPISDREWPTDVYVQSPNPLAVIEPRTMTFEPNSKPVDLALRCSSTVLISGRVTDYSGKPVSGRLLSTYALPSPGKQVLLDLPVTDADGRYESRRVPLGGKNVQIAPVGVSTLKGDVYLKPKARPHVKSASPRGDFVIYEQVKADIGNVDFECLPWTPKEGFLKAVPKELSPTDK